MQRSSIVRTLAVLALAVLLLFEGLASTLHRATVRHAVCPEHGELLDVAHHPDPSPQEEGPADPGEDPHDSHHDACAFVLLDLDRRPEFHGDLVLRGPEEATAVATPKDQPEGRLTVPRILFAPKHSPPA